MQKASILGIPLTFDNLDLLLGDIGTKDLVDYFNNWDEEDLLFFLYDMQKKNPEIFQKLKEVDNE